MKFRKENFFKKIFIDYKKSKKIPKIDLHVHTNWTDGKHTVKQMVKAANKKNLHTILFSEHSRANSKGWFSKFSKEVKKNRSYKKTGSCNALVGTEVKIKNLDGSLDLNQNIKKKCDLIMASVHRFPGEKGNIFKNKSKFTKNEAIELEFQLSMSAIKNSKFDILGHPFGMSIKRFKATPKWHLFKKLIKECKRNDKIFEINFHYHKNYRKLLEECLRTKTLFSLGSNAHHMNELGKITKI